jgi:hypothetical protein
LTQNWLNSEGTLYESALSPTCVGVPRPNDNKGCPAPRRIVFGRPARWGDAFPSHACVGVHRPHSQNREENQR